MRVEKLRKNVIVYNKVDGNYYQVTDIAGKGTDIVARAAEGEYDTDGEFDFDTDSEFVLKEEGKTVKITEKNALCFRFIEDPNPKTVPEGYSVTDDGVLITEDGEVATEQGELKIRRILKPVLGGLLLDVKNRHNDDSDIFYYDVEKDKFVKMISSIPADADIVYDNNSYFVLRAYKDEIRPVNPDEPEGETGTYVLDNNLIVFKVDSDSSYGTLVYRMFDPTVIVKGVKAVDATAFAYYGDTEIDEKGFVRPIEVNKYFAIDNLDNIFISEFEKDETVVIKRCMLDGILVAKSDSKIKAGDIMIKAEIISQLAGYNYLVDIGHENHVTTLAFANDDYEIKTLTSENTKDRGFIVKVS